MPLEVGRLRDSEIAGIPDAEVFRCAVLLWAAAWHQVPAGSLPDDDAALARLAGLGRDLKTWKRLRPDVLRGFRAFSDGRLYHRVVCEKVIEGINSTRHHEWVKACARVRKENHQRNKQVPKLTKLSAPDRPATISLAWPDEPARAPEREPKATVRVPEREFPPERKGRDILPRGAQEAHPLGTVPETSPTASARGSLEGSARDGEVVQLISRVAAAKAVPA
jgi:hypothetical protein